jgi:hypothetical protein
MKFQQKKTKRQHFRLEPRQQSGLETLAQQYETTISALIREAVDRLLASELVGKRVSYRKCGSSSNPSSLEGPALAKGDFVAK